jgi:hypothetical protein
MNMNSRFFFREKVKSIFSFPENCRAHALMLQYYFPFYNILDIYSNGFELNGRGARPLPFLPPPIIQPIFKFPTYLRSVPANG